MIINKLLTATIFFGIILCADPVKTNPFDALEVQTKLRKEDNNTAIFQKLKTELKSKRATLKDISHKKFLRRFYRQNSYNPLWFTESGFDKKRVRSLFEELESDITLDKKGKVYKQYQILVSYLGGDKRRPLRTELQLTALYIDFLNHTLYGDINWKSFSWKLSSMRKRGVSARWLRYKPDESLSELLLASSIEETIENITPKRFGYMGLLKSLIILQGIKEEGGWKELPYFKKLELEDKGLTVLKLRERLEASHDLTACSIHSQKLFEKDSDTEDKPNVQIQPRANFDICLEDAVKKFQKRHGLEADGIVGSGTRGALNRTVESKIETVLLNLNRIKWLPKNEDKRYLVANIPEYMLHYIEDGYEKKKLRIIVGDRKHHTPIFKDKISYVVLNPYWKVPSGIVRREIIPAMIRNPNYLKRQGLEIHTTWYERSPRVNPYNIFWEQYRYGMEKFPYRIMQPPGPKNALGKIKFKFPNRFDVYLHDTPSRRLFKRTHRAFSHGCVRLDQPQSLLETVASFNPSININKSKKILKGKRKVQLNIHNKLPIYIVYLTAGFDEETGELQFRNDVYQYDKMQKRVK